MGMRSADETLEEVDRLLEDLRERKENVVILVEGKKDTYALMVLGVEGDIRRVHNGKGIFRTAEKLAGEGKEAIILTDWDRKGGQLCRLLKNALEANEVPFDDITRAKLARLSKKEIKDVESLPSFVSRLVAESRSP